MDRPPFGQCLTLYASLNQGWADFTATMALDHGVTVWGWSARLLYDVAALLVRRAAGDDPLTRARVDADWTSDGRDGWGTIDAAEAARIIG